MRGYWRNPDATAETIVDGWLHTGDVGFLDNDGFLTITDRKKDLIITSGGKNVAPGELERILVSDPHIDQAVVYGDARPFVTALLVPNPDQLRETAGELSCEIEVRDGFIVCEPLIEFLQQRVNAIMQVVSGPERVRKFLLLARPFTSEADELTATFKIRRRHVIGKYESYLRSLYDST